jgi:hypothetical protein
MTPTRHAAEKRVRADPRCRRIAVSVWSKLPWIPRMGRQIQAWHEEPWKHLRESYVTAVGGSQVLSLASLRSMILHSHGWNRLPFGVALLLGVACTQTSRTVEIHGQDYAFMAPAAVPPGSTIFRFVNDGSVLHELQLFQFRKGTSPKAAATLLAAGPLPDSAYEGSGAVLITSPGTAAREQVIIPLGRGEVYGLLCQFRNADSLPRHSAMGMWAVLRVE